MKKIVAVLASLLAVQSTQLLMAQPAASKKSAVLISNGVSRVAIYVAPTVMAEDQLPAPGTRFDFSENERETQRRALRESVKDLAHYFQKMSGAKVEVLTSTPAPKDKRRPIFIGALAQEKFGPITQKSPGGQGFRVVVTPKAIGLYGEVDQSTSYAIYEVLDRLGCRWFMPSEMGEEIPKLKTVALPIMDFAGAPGTRYRSIWYADDDYRRRSRHSGRFGDSNYIAAGHVLEHYITNEQRNANPEWRAIINGKPDAMRLKWSHPGVQQAVADEIIARLNKHYEPSISLSPEDGGTFDESDDLAWDAGDYDPVMNSPSITDRYIKFCNIIAEKVTAKYPDVKLGFLAYVQYTQPPIREKLHPSLIPMFAPINYCRAHAMTDNCPSRSRVKPMIEGWGKAAPGGVAYYNYMYNLAEYSAPYPMMHQMKQELPIIYKSNVKYWMPEGMANFDQVLPGNYLAIRKGWNPNTNSDAILNEFFSRFYGHAENPMRRYWTLFDDQWTNVDEHSGGGWDYARRFTPDFMKKARAAMNEALANTKTINEYRRVEMQNHALVQFERWMQMVWDLNEGRLENLGPQSELWASAQLHLGNEYEEQYAFSKAAWSPNVALRWFSLFFQPSYLEATRLSQSHSFVSQPLRNWKYFVDKDKTGDAQKLFAPEYSDAAWKSMDIGADRFSTIGIPDYFGAVFYRQTSKAPALPQGKKVYLWLSRAEGTAKVWVNGKEVPYVSANGQTSAISPAVYGTPLSFDVTGVLQPDADNQITIKGTRTFINELGTGGLMGPVYLYRER